MIQAKGIEKSFGTLKVLKGVDIRVDKGEVVAIMGASGAGKSTLLQILGTLSTPDAGTLTVDGTDVLHLGSRELSAFRNKRIGFVFQAHHLLPEFDALENVMIPALIAGTSAREAREKARRLLGEVGLSERLSHKPSELSGGEQQRVAIARALMNDPAILFADEPSGNLDSRTKEEIHRLFFDLRDRLGQTVVIVTHDPSLAALCDRTLFMRDGQFIDRQ
ncbi:MAG: ABC transporter ATP-binding protein [Bacteroidales bacterium]|nr:ABC transporter ATP-binding protein [Bacteroidales bacterium]